MLGIALLACSPVVAADDAKQVVGATEIVEIEPHALRLKARVDSGVRTSSVHAEHIEIDATGDPAGKRIAFTLVNRDGQSRRLESRVSRLVTVRTSEGSDRRYAVPLTFRFRDRSKTVEVTLNDRSHMRYRLLLGRNWLRGDYLVDVEINDED